MFLIHLWVVLVGLVLMLYVLLDGFSLGVGILYPFAGSERERDIMMGSIGPVWDANQTWIVFGGGALFATFPMIYTVLFSALYIPLLTFLFGLIFRGVAFEFRANSTHKTAWDRAFFGGSIIAAFAQGVTLGGYLSGIVVKDGFFCRRRVRLVEPLQPHGRLRLGGRLCPFRSHLPSHQNHRRRPTPLLSPGFDSRCGGGGIHGDRQHLDTRPCTLYRPALVECAKNVFRMDLSSGGNRGLYRFDNDLAQGEGAVAVCVFRGIVRVGLSRTPDRYLSQRTFA